MIHQSRRDFLKTALVAAGTVSASRLFAASKTAATPLTGKEPPLRVAVIGCGGQGRTAHIPPALRQKLVALVDADDQCLSKAIKRTKEIDPHIDLQKIRAFNDYRKLFDAMGKELDAVLIATPNHHHALPALMAMQLGISAYIEKPMAYNVAEARLLAEYSRQYKVATQMGNQGHCGEGYRRLCEYIWAGAIGNVTEVYSWTDRANGGLGPRPNTETVPKGMHWDEWIGPAPFRDYHDDLHPHEWHGWHDFGDGSLGNMGCHVLDGPHWALKLGNPTSIELEECVGGSDERYPVANRIRWEYPARDGMSPVKVYWYDGKLQDKRSTMTGVVPGKKFRGTANRPPLVVEMERKCGRSFGGSGSLYVGDKGMMVTGTYGEGVRIIPEEKHKATPVPDKVLPRVSGGPHGDFFRACRGGEKACSNFETASRLTEMILLGCLAIKAGAGKKVEWDGDKCANLPELNRHLQRTNRDGWKIS
jgi:hypothetical protein